MSISGSPREVARNLFDSLQDGSPTATDLIRAASIVFDVKAGDITGRSRTRENFVARAAAMVLCVNKRGRTYGALKMVFDRDHTTIMHACAVAIDMIAAAISARASETVAVSGDSDYAAKVVQVWDLACAGRDQIVKAERARAKAIEEYQEEQNRLLIVQRLEREAAEIRQIVKAASRPQRPTTYGAWSDRQLAEMNQLFVDHMQAYGRDGRY